jgi:hypothetical protein
VSAPAFGSIGSEYGSSGTTASVPVPPSVASGDIIVVAMYVDSGATVTALPSGFAQAQNSPRTVNSTSFSIYVAWKRATGADTGTYDFTLSATAFAYGSALRYTGCVASGNPWDSPTNAADGGSTAVTQTPDVAVTTAGPDRMLFFVGENINGDAGTWTGASGFDTRRGLAGQNTNTYIADHVQTSTGSSGNVHAVSAGSGVSGAWLGALIGTTTSGATFPPNQARRRWLFTPPRLPRARMSAPVRAQVNPPFPFNEVKQPRRQRGQNLRRGEAFMPVPPQVVVPPPPYPPRSVRSRVKGLRLFRPHAVSPVPAQVAPPPLVYVPQAVRGRLKLPSIRRHDNAQPTIDQAAPLPRPPRSRPKPRPARGHIAAPTQPQALAPLFTRFKRRLARIFRGKPATVVPPQVVVIPPSYTLQAVRARRSQFVARRHRGGVEGWMVPGVHLCVTPRPNLGTTGRPGSGTTAYNTATTSRPSTGTTARPNTGITQDPC